MVNDNYAVRRGTTEIDFPSSDNGTTTAIHPFLGPANYQTLFNPTNFKGNVRMPRGVDYADLLHAVYYGPQEFRESSEAKEVRDIMRQNWLYVPNVNIWTPRSFGERHGVYVVFDSKGQGRNLEFNQRALDKRLDKGQELMPGVILADGLGFAHRDTYSGGEQTPEELAQNTYMVISYSPIGAKKLAEVSKKFKNKPRVWIVDNNSTESIKTVSALDDYKDRLSADGDGNDGSSRARSFGVK